MFKYITLMILFLNSSIILAKTFTYQEAKSIIDSDNINLLKEKISQGYEINNIVQNTSETILHTAIKSSRNSSVALWLINNGADVNIPDAKYRKETPVFYAVRANKLNIVNALIKKGANINALNLKKETALYNAINTQNTKAVKFLIKSGAKINIQNKDGNSPFHIAVKRSNYKNNYEIITILFQYRAQINIQNNRGETPLHLAIYKREINLTRLLLNHRAKVNIKDRYGNTPVHIACGYYRNDNIIKLLLKHKANINIQNREGNTPIFNACFYNNISAMELLISKGANPNLKNNRGQTVLNYAFTIKKYDIALYLLKKNINIKTVDNNGNSPLHNAVTNRYFKKDRFLKLILNKYPNININQQNKLGETPLHYAFRYKNYSAAKILIDSGANLEIRDKNGERAFDYIFDAKNEYTLLSLSNNKYLNNFFMQHKKYSHEYQSALKKMRNKRKMRERKEFCFNAGFGIGIPLVYMGTAIYLREKVYKDDPENNNFAVFNGMASSIVWGGALMGLTTGLICVESHVFGHGPYSGLGAFVLGGGTGLAIGATVGAFLSYKYRDKFKENRGLYYGSAATLSITVPLIVYNW